MTKEENISTLNEHLEHWKRLLSEKICDQDEGEKTIDALQNAIKALEQEPCENCCNGNQIEKAKLCQKSYLAGMEHKQEPCEDTISRQAAINAAIDGADKWDGGFNREREKCIQEEIEKLPPVTPQPCGDAVLDKIKAEIDSHCSDNRDRNDGLYIAMKIIDKYKAEGSETWNGYHRQITAPKGTFERIFNDADDDNDDI